MADIGKDKTPPTSRRQADPAPRPPARPAARRTDVVASRPRRSFSMDGEQQARLLLYGITALVVLAAAALIAFGYYWSEVRPRNRTVLEAEGTKVSYSAMKRRMTFELFANPAFQQTPAALPEATYENLLTELTLIHRADDELGVTYTEDEFNEQLRERVGVAKDADDATFTERFRSALSSSGLKESEYRRLVQAELLEEKVRAKFEAEAPATIPQARIEVIQTETQEAAQQAINRINAGEEFGAVARELSKEPDVSTTGGLKPFGAEGTFPPSYDELVFTQPVGELSAPIQSAAEAWHVVRVVERSEQPLTEGQKPTYVTERYVDWLRETQGKMTIVDKWDTEDQNSALVEVVEKAAPRLAEQIQQTAQPAITVGIPPAVVPTTGAAPTAPAAVPTTGG